MSTFPWYHLISFCSCFRRFGIGAGPGGWWFAFTWGFLFCFHADSGVGDGGSPSHDNFCSAFMQMVVVGIGMQIAHPGCPFS